MPTSPRYDGPERRMEDPWRLEMERRVLAIENDVTTIKNQVKNIDDKVDANTNLTQQVLDATSEVRTAVTRGRWLARATAATVKWVLGAVRRLAAWAAPIVAVVLAVLAFLGITWKGPPPP